MTETNPAQKARSGGFQRAAAMAMLALGLAALGGCGGDDDGGGTIPPDRAEALITQLEAVQEGADEGDCRGAGQAAQAFVETIDTLPAEVGVETKEALRAAGQNLALLTEDPDECEPSGATGLDGAQPDTTTSAPTTTATTTTTTQETTTEEDDDDDQSTPPGQGGAPPGHSGGGNSGTGGGEIPPDGGSGGTGGTDGED